MSDIDNFLDGTTTKPVAPAGAQKQSSQIDDFLGDAPAPARGLKGWGQDIAATAVKGAIGVPEMLVGLADIPTGGRVGKFLANDGGDFGFRPKEAKEIVNDWHSDATKEAQRKFGEAKGIWDKAKTAIENPSLIATSVGESLPLMGAGGVAARGLMAATRLGQMGTQGAALAGAVGEGITMAGSAAEQIRQETKDGLLTPEQSGLALATGVAGSVFGFAGARVANKLGIGDADTLLAQGARGVAREAEESAAARTGAAALQRTALSNIPKKVIQGAISEGFFEELPQSVAEQIFQNMALDKPWDTDLDSAAVMGVLSGGAMGGPASGVHAYGQYRNGNAPQPPGQQQGQPPGTQPNNSAPPVNPGLERVRQAFLEQLQALQAQEQGEPTVPQVEPPNGAAILAQRQAENRAITSPDDEIYQSTGYNEYAQRQSEIANQPPELNPSLERARQGLTNQLEHLQTQEQGEPTVPQAAPPDGAAVLARQQAQQQAARDAVNQVNRAVTSPDDEIYQSTGRGFTPSQRMGINPKAGPLSAGAAIALDTGVSTPIQQAAAMPTSLRAQSGDEAGSVWSQMPTAQRMELAQRVDLKPIIKNNLHSAQWEGINPEIQSKLAQAMQTQGGLATTSELAQSQPTPDAPLTRAPDIATGPARVLQNRDRSTAASIGQMNDIASAPDYLRAGQARVMDSGAPVVFGTTPNSALMGKQQQIADGHGARVPVQYAVVEAADVLASHQADGTPIAQYQLGVPGQLRAVAGNGRAAGITEAYRRGTTTQYRQDLIDDALDLGVDPEAISAMSAPMLVRVMPEEHVTDDMGDRSNISGTAALSATEQANNDTKRLDLSALSFDEAGTPDRQSIAQFVNAMPVGERGAMMQPDGSPTRQVIDRITSAAFKAAYGNDELVSLQSQSTDPEIRNIITALANVAGPMAGLEGAGDLDIRGAVSEAAQMAVNAKRMGVPLADYLNNADMGFSGEAFVVAKFMADNIRSAKRMAEGLRAWVTYVAEQVAVARDNQTQDGLFGAAPTASRNDVFNQLGATNEQANTSTTPLQNGSSGPSRVTSSPQRQEAQPVTEPSRPADFEENNAQEVAPEVEASKQPLDQAENKPEKQGEASNGEAQADASEVKANLDERNSKDVRGKAKGMGIDLKDANGKFKVLPVLVAEIKAAEDAAAAPAKPEPVKGKPTSSNSQDTGFLASPTAEQVVAQQDQSAAAAKAETAQRRAQDERDRLERERKDIAKASEAAADTFELGGDAEQNLSGQRDIFGEAPTTPEAEKPQVKANTIFTEDAAAAARARLKAKLGRLNSGIDPEMLMDGITLAGYHIEQGARTFTAYAKAMIEDLGDGVKPYLKSWYMAISFDPRASSFSADMTPVGEVATLDLAELNEPSSGQTLSQNLVAAIESGNMPKDNPALKKLVEAFDGKPNNGQKGELNVPSADSRVERDSQESSLEPAVGDAVSSELRGADATVAQAGGRPHRGAGSGQQDGAGVPFGSAPVAGERGDQRLHPNDQPAELASIVTGADFGESGGDSGVAGVPAEPIAASQVDAVAQPRPQGLKDIIERNKANKAPVELGDIDSIRATLPQLLTGQQDDVKLAEDRFAKPDGYGMLFTNGTGTGKTFSGLGIIKRFSLQGKTNTLIAVPDSKIASDWIESGKRLGLGLSLLKDTKDAGSGIVITTYANLGENDQLARRSWDLVVADEAHTLMQAADGAPTSYLHNLRAITNHPDGAGTRHTMLNRDAIERAAALEQEIADTARDISGADTTVMRRNALEVKNEKLQLELSALRQKLNAEQSKVSDAVKAAQGAGRTRLVALSATPFAYEKTIDWANGYLFDYNDGQASDKNEFRGYNSGSNKDRYMMRHFGYSMSTNRLTRPDAKVDTGLMQRQWNANLKKSGALSGRMLDVAPDYDRRFILVESAIGNRIDEALEWLNAQRQAEKGSRHFADLSDIINDQFKFLQKRYLLEAIKATEVIPIVKAHMALGRKVVVFHDYKKGGGFNPFHVRVQDSDMRPAFESFKAQFGDLINAPLGSMPSPIEVFKRELPQTLLINGDEKEPNLLARYKSFQDDANGPQVMLVQSNKNKGWSGHDTTGKHQRVLINLGQPTAPTLAIQQEGRIYRTGQASDAIMRYMNTGTNWERWTFATTIATRASTAENLGMGEMARALKDSFIQSFEESDTYAPGHEGEGKGGKERDKVANDALTEFDRAKSHYWATQKKNSRTKAQEGVDYFATPEPLGLKMTQWLDARSSEAVMEPSAGHGAIARWIPDNTSRTVIEPSLALRSRLSMVMNPLEDRIIGGSFEEHHVSNKYDGIVMNPPFGTGGRMAVDHLAKAATHLRDGGRIVALIPAGPAADKAFEKWFYEASEKPVKPLMLHPTLGPIYKGDTVYVPGYEQTTFKAFGKKGELLEIRAPGYGTTETIDRIVKVEPTGPRSESVKPAEGLQLVANVKLPQVTFERAGTAVSTRVVVIEKSDRDIAQSVRDLSSITEINELFDRLENLDFAGRTKPVEPIEAKAGKAAKADDKPAKVVASVGDEVTIGGKAYPVEIYTTSAGKEKRGVWMDSKAEASKYSARTFTTSSNKGKWFVDEYWFPKDSEISKPDAAFSRKDELGSGSTVNWTDSKDQSHAAKVAVAIEKAEPGKPAYDYTIVEPQGYGKSRGNRTQAGAKNISDALDERVRGFERAFGRTVIFVRANGASPSFFNGFILPKSDPNTIYVNADASVNLMSVLGHEFYEGIAAKSPTLHAWFVTEAVKQLEKGALTKYSSRLAAAGDTQDIAGRFKELLADFTGDALADPLFRQSLNDANPSRFKVLIRALMAYLQKVLNRLTNTPVAGGLTGGKDLGSSEYFKDIQTLRAVLKDVIKQADSGGNLASFLSSNAMFSRKQIVGETTRQHTPEQLRAMANVGFQVEVPTLQERAKALWADAGKKLTQGIVDQFSPVKDLSKDAYRLLRMSKGASGAFEALMHGGRLKLTDGVYDIDRTQRGGAVEKLFKPMQGEHHDFLRWVAANRAERLLGDGREHLFTQADIDALKTLADGTLNHAYTLKNGARAGQTTTDRREMYRDSLVTFNEFNANALDMAEQSGLINADGRKDWESEFYVPFYRAMQEDGSGVVGGNIKSGVVRQSAFKHLKGGKDKLNADLLDNTLMNWAHLLDAGAKNRAALATLEAAQGMGVAIEASANVARDIGKATHNRNGVVWAMDEGVQRYFVVDDPYILTALTSLEYAGMKNPVMNAMGTMKRVLTIGVTASPFFKIRNLIRDSVQAIGLGDMSYNIGSNLKEGWKLTDPKSDAYFSLLASGGTIHFGSMYEGNESKRIQALVESGIDRDTILNDPYRVKEFYRKTLEPMVTAYNEVGNRGEAINRAALYDQLVKKGVSHAEAALQARDLMDFSMQGAFTSVRFLTQVVPFMNARLQGLYKLGKSAKENPQRFTTVLAAVAAVSLALLAAYGDDDDWKRRDESDRNNFWWLKIGGVAYRVPKPFEVGAIATLAERGFELAFDKEMTGPRFRTQVLKLLGDNLSMNPVPQLVKPMLDVYSNIDGFTDRPIESMGMDKLKSEYRYNDRTSMVARGASTAMNAATGLLGKEALSPVQIDHMLRGYFGWLGSFVVGTADLLARPATGQVDKAAPDHWKTLTGNMASDLRDAPSRYVSQMYEQAKEIERAYGTWRELQKQGKTQEAQEFRSEHLKELNQYHHVEAVKRQEALFNQQSRRIERSDMQPDMKRERLRAIGEQKHKLAKSLA